MTPLAERMRRPGSRSLLLAQLRQRPLARFALWILSVGFAVSLFADVLASDRPLVCRDQGAFVLLANLRPSVACAETWLRTPIPFGPNSRGPLLLPPWHTSALPPGVGLHLLGTDAQGRDVAARIVHGTRTSFVIGIVTVLASSLLGTLLGGLAGFFGGGIDAVLSRLVETITAFPTLVLVLVVQAVLPNPSMGTLLAAIALTRWTEVARLVRIEVIHAGSLDYVLAARALGASPLRVLVRHIAPNAAMPAIVASTFGVVGVILIQAALDFLHVGVPSDTASWGETLSEARTHAAWWLLAFPGLALLVTLGAVNLVVDALRDALNPRLRFGGRRDR